MPKHEVGSAKWTSNQMRKNAKTKIRWYCGLCSVACKDENGYKCHLEFEGHIRRQMAMEESKRCFKLSDSDIEFRKKFLTFLVSKHFGQTVLAHDIYRDLYPIDRGHNIMKATCWETLGVFIAQLRKEGSIEAHKGLKGWQIRVSSKDFVQDGVEDTTAQEKVTVNNATDDLKRKGESGVLNDVEFNSHKRLKPNEAIESHSESTGRINSGKVQFSMTGGSISAPKKSGGPKLSMFDDSED